MPNQPAAPALAIFIAYRREDVQFAVDRLDSDLRREFGQQSVFRDTKDIGLELWKHRIDAELDQANVVIVAIGPRWLSAVDDEGAKRLWQVDDRLRIEIEKALDRGIRVVPVQLEGAKMPLKDELPKSLEPLAEWQSEEIDSRRWDEEIAEFVEKLKLPGGLKLPGEELPNGAEPPLPTVWIAVGVLVIIAMIVLVAVGFN